jgi:hypothetical protein
MFCAVVSGYSETTRLNEGIYKDGKVYKEVLATCFIIIAMEFECLILGIPLLHVRKDC